MTEPRDQNEDLRRLFQDAASEVRPQGTYDDILERTKKVDPMTRRWFLPVVAAAAVIGLAIGGAAWIARDSDSPKGNQGPATTPSSVEPTKTAVAMQKRDATVFYLGDGTTGPRLFSESHQVEVGESRTILEAAANEAVGGEPSDPDYRNVWPAATSITGVSFDGIGDAGELQVTFARSVAARPAGISAKEAGMAVDALVRTVQAAAKAPAPVSFYVEGSQHQIEVLGVPTNEPLAAGADDDSLALVSISSPANGATVPAGDLKVTGMAAAFEANVIWELVVGGDVVVKHGHTTARECCTLAPYEFTINDLAPGTYTLVVHDEDMSGEGRPVNQDTKEIVVR
jgi:hypothetical protein